jgi:predicted nucleic acid-binding protein
MALTHLLETSVLTRLGDPSVHNAITQLKNEEKDIGRTDISDLEIGFAARNAPEWDNALTDLEVFELVQTTTKDVRRAKDVQRLLAVKHQRGRKVPDLLIAASAESNGLIVLHYDTDFDLIASVTGQSCQWIVPKGSVH